MLAASFGHIKVVKILLSSGADQYATDRVSITAYSFYIVHTYKITL